MIISLTPRQGSKRALANLEGHGDPTALHPWSQFLAAGMGGIISQSVTMMLPRMKFND